VKFIRQVTTRLSTKINIV